MTYREVLFVRGRRHLRSLAQPVSAVLLLLASPTHAETSLMLDCKPELVSSAGDKDPVVSVAVLVSGLNWRVTHIAASGKRYERAEQYGLHDVSDQSARVWTWQGTLINARSTSTG